MSDAPRTIIQIAVSSGAMNGPDILYALASDGTVWELVNQADYNWQPLPVLPAVGAAPSGRARVKP
jgi:hypothetical protein